MYSAWLPSARGLVSKVAVCQAHLHGVLLERHTSRRCAIPRPRASGATQHALDLGPACVFRLQSPHRPAAVRVRTRNSPAGGPVPPDWPTRSRRGRIRFRSVLPVRRSSLDARARIRAGGICGSIVTDEARASVAPPPPSPQPCVRVAAHLAPPATKVAKSCERRSSASNSRKPSASVPPGAPGHQSAARCEFTRPWPQRAQHPAEISRIQGSLARRSRSSAPFLPISNNSRDSPNGRPRLR